MMLKQSIQPALWSFVCLTGSLVWGGPVLGDEAPEPNPLSPTLVPTELQSETGLKLEVKQSLKNSPSGLTLERLQQLAVEHNPTLVQARAETWKAHGQYVQAGLKPNPRLGFVAEEVGNEGDAGLQGAFFSQEFVTGGKLCLSQQIFAMRQKGATWEMTSQYYRVENNVRREYYNILIAQRLVKLTSEVRKIAENSLRITKDLYERDEASKISQLQASVELQRTVMLTRNAELELDAAWNRLRSVIGWDQLPQEPLFETENEAAPHLEWETTVARLLELSPQVQQAQFNASSARAAYTRARAEPTPNVTVQAGTLYDTSTNDTVANVQLSMPIPVFNKNQGNIRTAHSDWIRASREVQRVKLQLARNLADEFKKYVASQAKIELYRKKMLPACEETIKLSQLAFEAGQLNFLQLLTAQQTYAETNIEYVQAKGILWQSQVAIDGLLLTNGLQAPKQAIQLD